MSGEGAPQGRDEVRDLVEALRRAVLELRSVIDELSNPLMPRRASGARADAGEERLAEEGRTAQEASDHGISGAGNASNGDSGEPANREPAAIGSASAGLRLLPEAEAPGGAPLLARETPAAPRGGGRGVAGLSLERLAGLARLVYELQTRVPPEYLAGIADILYDSGLIDSRQRETLRKLIELARLGYEHGVAADESIAILAALARELGLDVTEITEELVKAILRRRGGESWESRQQ